MKITKKMSLATLSLVSAFTLAACGQENSDDAIATGDNINISEDDFIEKLKDTSGSAVLQQMVLTEVFENEVGKDKVKELKEQADQQLALLKQQYDEESKFESVLQSYGFNSEEGYKDQLYYYSLMSAAVSDRISISDKELKAAYDEYEAPIEVSHILVDDEEKAKDLINQLNDGADFAELAKENSSDSTAQNGGSLGKISKGQMVPEFEEAAFALEEGKYSEEPVKTKYGYHIIKVTKKPEKGSLEDEKAQLEDSLRQEKMQDEQTVKKIVRQLIKDHNVKVNDKDLENALNEYLESDKTAKDVQQNTASQSSESPKDTQESSTEQNDALDAPADGNAESQAE